MSEDSDGSAGLTRRRMLAATLTTGVAAAGAGAGTFALFQDTESSTGNTVQAGTMSLNIHDGDSLQWKMTGVAPGNWSQTQDIIMEHTGSVAANHLELDFQNVELEDDDGDPQDASGNWSLRSGPESDPMTGTDGSGSDPGAAGMAKYIKVIGMSYDPDTKSSDSTEVITLVNLDGQPAEGSPHNLKIVDDTVDAITLYDLAHPDNEDTLDNLEAPEPGSVADSDSASNDDVRDTRLQIQLKLHPDTPNEYQGDAVVTTVSAALHQDSSQNV